MNLLMLPRQTVFICDTYVDFDPSAAALAEMALLVAAEVRRFGLMLRLALLSHSSFGSADNPLGPQDARRTCELIRSARRIWRWPPSIRRRGAVETQTPPRQPGTPA